LRDPSPDPKGYFQVSKLVEKFTFIIYLSAKYIYRVIIGWRVHHMDVKTNFLNGETDEEVYIEKPNIFMIHEKESHVCRLKKALYVL
jgi:hypothetical protein